MVIDRVLQFRFCPECWVSGASSPPLAVGGIRLGGVLDSDETREPRPCQVSSQRRHRPETAGRDPVRQQQWRRLQSPVGIVSRVSRVSWVSPCGARRWEVLCGSQGSKHSRGRLGSSQRRTLRYAHQTTNIAVRTPDSWVTAPPVHRAMRGEPYIPLPALASGCPPQLPCLFSR